MRTRPAALTGAIALALCLAPTGCDDGPGGPRPPGSVEGKVTEVESGDGVDSALVVLVDVEDLAVASEVAATDEEGLYRIDGVRPGDYAPLVFHEALVTRERPAPRVPVRSNKVTDFDIELVYFDFAGEGGYRIEGSVTDAETMEPVPGAHVGPVVVFAGDLQAYAAGFAPWSTVTDSLGSFSVPGFLLGSLGEDRGLVPINVTKEGYEPSTMIGEGFTIPEILPPLLPLPEGDDRTLSLDFVLQPLPASGTGPHGAGAVRGRLMSLGQPVAGVLVGASVSFVSDPDTFRAPPVNPVPVPDKVARTDRDGSFTIEGLTPGNYSLDPAYPIDDGYVFSTFLLGPSGPNFVVEDSSTFDFGIIEMGRALLALSPAVGAAVQDTTPEFRWSAVPEAPGYTFVDYELQYGNGWVLYSVVDDLTEPRWQMPVSRAFSPGDNVRWAVRARAFSQALGDTVTIGVLEWPATFKVAE